MVPGAHTGFHRHEYDYVIVPITDGRMRIAEGDRESSLRPGLRISAWRYRDVSNGGDTERIFGKSKSCANDPGSSPRARGGARSQRSVECLNGRRKDQRKWLLEGAKKGVEFERCDR